MITILQKAKARQHDNQKLDAQTLGLILNQLPVFHPSLYSPSKATRIPLFIVLSPANAPPLIALGDSAVWIIWPLIHRHTGLWMSANVRQITI